MTQPPGAIISEWLAKKGRTQAWLAEECKRPKEQLNRLLNGRIRLTERWAIELATALPMRQSAMDWLCLEAGYRLDLALSKKRIRRLARNIADIRGEELRK